MDEQTLKLLSEIVKNSNLYHLELHFFTELQLNTLINDALSFSESKVRELTLYLPSDWSSYECFKTLANLEKLTICG